MLLYLDNTSQQEASLYSKKRHVSKSKGPNSVTNINQHLDTLIFTSLLVLFCMAAKCQHACVCVQVNINFSVK